MFQIEKFVKKLIKFGIIVKNFYYLKRFNLSSGKFRNIRKTPKEFRNFEST